METKKNNANHIKYDDAILAVKDGERVARDNDFFKFKNLNLEMSETDERILICNDQGTKSTYIPSEEDITSDDWIIIVDRK